MVTLEFIGDALNDFDTLAGYLVDSCLSYAVSDFEAMALLHSTASAVFPLVSAQTFRTLDANIAVYILATLTTVVCLFPRLSTKYGEQIRARSRFAKVQPVSLSRKRGGQRGIIKRNQQSIQTLKESRDSIGAEASRICLAHHWDFFLSTN
jgi:hypothetical protein